MPSTTSRTLRQAGQGDAAGRPPRRRDRRRHDGDRHRRAEQGARRRTGDDGLPPRPGAHEREPLRAGVRADARRDAAALGWRRASYCRDGARVRAVEFETTRTQAGETAAFTLDADVVFKAIGQKVLWDRLGDTAEIVELEAGPHRRSTKNERLRCPACGPAATASPAASDLTVSAVQDGKLAALSIDRVLKRRSCGAR